MYFTKTPGIVKPLWKDMVWRFNSEEEAVYLTFDDGPHPEVTRKVMSLLDQYDAKATFFCVGNNAEKHPEIIDQLKNAGHSIGHHTMNHVNGWKTKKHDYITEVDSVPESIRTTLFRPPYGKITKGQTKAIKDKYKIIMWDVLSADFDPSITKEKCFQNVVKNVEPGSIVVFHDSIKAEERMLFALEKSLEELSSKGYKFLPIEG